MKKTISLKSNREFTRVYKRGKFQAGRYIVLYVLQNNLNINRLGITTSKKIGKSVKRNRIKRLIRENYRLSEDRVKVGYDLVFVARNTDDMPDYYKIKKEVNYLLRKFNLIYKDKKEEKTEGNKEEEKIEKIEEQNIVEEKSGKESASAISKNENDNLIDNCEKNKSEES
ncbi:MAG TPA: ribonuclease P protein component [Clostridiaceae bacterium]|nr:ribonuclease P protein component [Clostridiaceae bacterium]